MYKVGDIVLYINTKDKKLEGTSPLNGFVGKKLKIVRIKSSSTYDAHIVGEPSSNYHEVYNYEVSKEVKSHLPKWW